MQLSDLEIVTKRCFRFLIIKFRQFGSISGYLFWRLYFPFHLLHPPKFWITIHSAPTYLLLNPVIINDVEHCNPWDGFSRGGLTFRNSWYHDMSYVALEQSGSKLWSVRSNYFIKITQRTYTYARYMYRIRRISRYERSSLAYSVQAHCTFTMSLWPWRCNVFGLLLKTSTCTVLDFKFNMYCAVHVLLLGDDMQLSDLEIVTKRCFRFLIRKCMM